MAESDDDMKKRKLRELEGKNVAFYSTLLSAWIQTKMERDKTLVTLSSAAIGLLVTILTTVGVNHHYILFIYIAAFIGFGICIGTSLKIYQLNSKHLENELGNKSSEIKLEKYDKRSFNSFLCGVFFLCFIGIYSAYSSLTITENSTMSNENKQLDTSEWEKRSLDGISDLRPQEPEPAKKDSDDE